MRDHLLVTMTQDDDDPPWVDLARGREHMEQHGPAAHLVQHLGKLRLHPFAWPAASTTTLAIEELTLVTYIPIVPHNKERKLGRQDSNLRIAGPKPAALPLGYAPTLPARSRRPTSP